MLVSIKQTVMIILDDTIFDLIIHSNNSLVSHLQIRQKTANSQTLLLYVNAN
jgi:hypothetical protein